MPGLVGAIGVSTEVKSKLMSSFLNRWSDCKMMMSDEVAVAAHSFGPAALQRFGGQTLVLLDGEWSVYQEVEQMLRRGFQITADQHLHDAVRSVGNVVTLRLDTLQAELSVDDSGTFPLYYSEHQGGLLFSNLLRPLADAIGATKNDLAVLEFVREGYVVGDKTAFLGVKRMLAGQRLLYQLGNRSKVRERSRAWITSECEDSRRVVSHDAWSKLTTAVKRSVPPASATLMMSGGWDSRTLMAAAVATGRTISCYAHGDQNSRELRIVREVCAVARYACDFEPIDDRCLDPLALQESFKTTENVVFPHWHRAGRILRANDAQVAVAGIYGEVLGGHYGPAMLAEGFGKILAVAKSMFVAPNRRGLSGTARQFLSIESLQQPWYLHRWVIEDQVKSLVDMNGAVEESLRRLNRRGVTDELSLVEAFITEHRAAQYVSAQLLACRSSVDVSIPFADQDLFNFASKIRLEDKIHNALNRRMLIDNAPHLLRSSMASTLVRASAPIVLQEASRAVRKSLDYLRDAVHAGAGKNLIGPSRSGWVNFSFLRNGRSLFRILEDLRCEMWDRDSMMHTIRSHLASADGHSLHPLYDQMLKIYTTDLLLRQS